MPSLKYTCNNITSHFETLYKTRPLQNGMFMILFSFPLHYQNNAVVRKEIFVWIVKRQFSIQHLQIILCLWLGNASKAKQKIKQESKWILQWAKWITFCKELQFESDKLYPIEL